MATPRGSEHRDLEQRLRNLEQRYADLSTRVLSQRKLEVSEGDFVVKGGGNIVILDNAGQTVWDALSGPIKATAVSADQNAPGLTSAWTPYLTRTITVPPGYKSAVVTIAASVGVTAAGGASAVVGVWPVINNGDLSGPAVSQGSAVAAVCSVASTWTWTGPIPGGASSFTVGLQAYKNGTINAGSDNVHLSASVLLLR